MLAKLRSTVFHMRSLHNLLQKFLGSTGMGGGLVFCAFFSTCDIAFSVNLLVSSCAVVYACVIFVISHDTLFVNIFNSCVFMLNCCRITVD